MENWHKCVFLSAALCSLTAVPALGQDHSLSEQVIHPDIERRKVAPAHIDRQDFEVGAFAGIISIQDFDSEVVYGARAAWHVTEDFFFEATYGVSEGDLTSYEKLSGGAPLFTDSERDYSYYNINLGWNIFPGEVFIFDKYAFQSDFYLIGGAGNTEFLGDNWFTVTVGAGYRLQVNDTLAWRIDLRDHIYDREAFGSEETTNNIEWSTGLTFFF